MMEDKDLFSQAQLLNFLAKAKQNTYPSDNVEYVVEPELEGSKQFEFAEGDFYYRDIYYGNNFFVGQEVVYFKQVPIWSMTYSGGMTVEAHEKAEEAVFMFLKEALKRVSLECPLRGPKQMDYDKFRYKNAYVGNLGRFCGLEQIFFEEQEVYQLNYIGGLIK
jgi:hypothetical protein